MPKLAPQIVPPRGLESAPWVQFKGVENGQYRVTMALVTSKGRNAPEVMLGDQKVQAVATGKFKEHTLARYEFNVPMTADRQQINYQVCRTDYSFPVPAVDGFVKVMASSCNGYQDPGHREQLGGITPMWHDLKYKDREHQINRKVDQMILGGDQVYCDGVYNKKTPHAVINTPRGPIEQYGLFALESLRPFLEASDEDKLNFQFTSKMREEVSDFYFYHYLNAYKEEGFSQALASIPGLFMGDDHDYHFDGWGSYRPELQNCPVFQGIAECSLPWYLFFQQHMLAGDKPEDVGLFQVEGTKGYNWMRVINNGRMAIVAPDTRGDRTRERIIPETVMDEIYRRIEALPDTVDHLLWVLPGPVLAPHARKSEGLLHYLQEQSPLLGRLIEKVKVMRGLFGYELDDDIKDAWGAHPEERDAMMTRLAEIAEKKNMRITYFGGDEHRSGVGHMYRQGQADKAADVKSAHGVNITPIGNIGAPRALCDGLERYGRTEHPIGPEGYVFKMLDLKQKGQEDDPQAESVMISNERIFGVFKQLPSGDLQSKLYIEPSPEEGKERELLKKYVVRIPAPPLVGDEIPEAFRPAPEEVTAAAQIGTAEAEVALLVPGEQQVVAAAATQTAWQRFWAWWNGTGDQAGEVTV